MEPVHIKLEDLNIDDQLKEDTSESEEHNALHEEGDEKEVKGKLNKLCKDSIEFHLFSARSSQHTAADNGEKIHKCKECSYSCCSARSLKKHATIHSVVKPFNCAECPYRARTKHHLTSHMWTHRSDKPLKCHICSFSTGLKSVLKRHIPMHSIVKPFKCSECPYRARTEHHLTSHMWTHTSDKPLKCPICSFSTGQKSVLRKHMPMHSVEKPFKCAECPYSARIKHYLTAHMWTHKNDKPFKCSVCSFSTGLASFLRRHMSMHSELRPFKCSECPYRGGRPRDLRLHAMIHTGLKPLKCPECSYSTFRNTNLQRHAKIHSGEKPYECAECSYKCGNFQHLKRHISTHLRDKAHRCPECSYSSSQEKYLRIHILARHSKQPRKCQTKDTIDNKKTTKKCHNIIKPKCSSTAPDKLTDSYNNSPGDIMSNDARKNNLYHIMEPLHVKSVNVKDENTLFEGRLYLEDRLVQDSMFTEDCVCENDTSEGKSELDPFASLETQECSGSANTGEHNFLPVYIKEENTQFVNQPIQDGIFTGNCACENDTSKVKSNELNPFASLEAQQCSGSSSNTGEHNFLPVYIKEENTQFGDQPIQDGMFTEDCVCENDASEVKNELNPFAPLEPQEFPGSSSNTGEHNFLPVYIKEENTQFENQPIQDEDCECENDLNEVNSELDPFDPLQAQECSGSSSNTGEHNFLPVYIKEENTQFGDQPIQDTGGSVEHNTHSEEEEGDADDKEVNGEFGELCENPSETDSLSTRSSLRKPAVNRDKPHKCEECSYSCYSLGNLKKHATTHNGTKPFKCDLCPYRGRTKAHLTSHVWTHSCDKPLKCSLCSFSTGLASSLRNHMSVHTVSRPYKCSECPYRGGRPGDLRLHAMIHTGLKPFECTECSYSTFRKHHLNRHAQIHSGEKPYECAECSYKCRQFYHLKLHMSIHTQEKPYECTECSYSCAEKRPLREHIMVKHSKERPHNCGLCKYSTARASNLHTHMRVVHKQFKGKKRKVGTLAEVCVTQIGENGGNQLKSEDGLLATLRSQENSANSSNTSAHTDTIPIIEQLSGGSDKLQVATDKSFKCEICPYGTNVQRCFKAHVVSHNADKPYKCSKCPFSCARACDFRAHMALASHAGDGDKPFRCTVCPYRCFRRAHLKRHMTVHTGEKAFKCMFCPYRTSQNDHMKLHVARKHF